VKRLVVLLVVIAGLLVWAGVGGAQNAATVNGSAISSDTLNSQLSAIAHSTEYQCYLNANATVQGQSAEAIEGVGGSSTVATAFATSWLSQLIEVELVRQVADERGVTVNADDQAVGRFTLEQQIDAVLSEASQSNPSGCGGTAAQILATLPSSFVDHQVEAQATQDALLASYGGHGLSLADQQAYFEAHRDDFQTVCVTEAQVTSQTAATALAAKVAAGTPLSTAAPSGSSATGCVSPSSGNYTAIASAVNGLAPGGVSKVLTAQAPSSTSSGEYVIFQLNSRSPSSFEESQNAVRDTLLGTGSTKADAALLAAVKRATVSVDPQYGTWVARSSELIALPAFPPISSMLNPLANLPSAG